MDTSSQLEELQLIQSTLLPEEILTFLDEELQEAPVWSQLLRDYAEDALAGDASIPPVPPRIQVKLTHSNTWLEVRFPTPANPAPSVSIKGEGVTRTEQERWRGVVREKLDEIASSDFPVYQLVYLHLLPLLHEHTQMRAPSAPADEHALAPAPDARRFHALFTSHHLIAPKKRRALQQWSGALAVAGFAKVGYPGVIYAQGAQESVEEFVGNVKGMQWLALRLRFVEALPELGREAQAAGWNEFEKVGEAVEAMRRLGLEEWIVEMGVGSKSS